MKSEVMEKFVKQKVPVSYPVSYPVCQICTRPPTFSAGSKGNFKSRQSWSRLVWCWSGVVRCWSVDGPVWWSPHHSAPSMLSPVVLSQDHHEITTPSSNPTVSSTRPSGFRRQCFNGSSQDGHNSSHKPLQLTDFTKVSHR
jgi:hypothetical protein